MYMYHLENSYALTHVCENVYIFRTLTLLYVLILSPLSPTPSTEVKSERPPSAQGPNLKT